MSADSLELLFREFCLPTMAASFGEMIQSAEAQNWGYRKLLLHLCEAEAADRRERKRERLLRESKLPSGKTLGNLADGQLPAKVRRQLPTLLEGGLCGASGEPAGLWAARPRQDALFVCAGTGTDPAAGVCGLFHADL